MTFRHLDATEGNLFAEDPVTGELVWYTKSIIDSRPTDIVPFMYTYANATDAQPIPSRARTWPKRLIVAALVIIIDVTTKAVASHTYWNDQFALGAPGLATSFETVLMALTLVAMFFIYDWMPWWCWALMAGGAAANLYDRLHYGAVHDFIVTGSIPIAYNVADVALLIGAVGWLLSAHRKGGVL